MSSRTIKMLAWLWIAALLTATVGVSMHRIYCYCVGQEMVSLFSHTEACMPQERTSAADCCRKAASLEETSCCSSDAGESERVTVENLSSRRVVQGVVGPGGDVWVSR